MYRKIYVPVDNSDWSNAAVAVAVRLAVATGAELVGSHVYAARMHDVRFKQMEYTLPEEYQDEQELVRQRKIHDSLITRGLQLISDSYLDAMKEVADAAGCAVEYKTFDGKNWECLVEDINDSAYDLVVMGALGMGAVKDSSLGSVTDRVVRRIRTDTIVIRDLQAFGEGASDRIVVGVDGSPQSFAGLKTAIDLARVFGKRVEAVGVYDPYLHYAMFNGIVDVLSAEASKVFRFKEQEQLHEEIIDTGLAKIYESHLRVASSIAREEGVELTTTLLDGKAFKKVVQHLREAPPWLVVMGRIGVHSHESMDIGSNSDNVLRLAPCNVLLSSRTYVPPVDTQAEAAVVWTDEATAKIEAVPAHARGVARTAICRWAMERGHSIISSGIIDDAIADIMPEYAGKYGAGPARTAAYEMTEAAAAPTWICRRCGRPSRAEKPVVCVTCEGTEFEAIDKAAVSAAAAREGTEEETAFDGFKVQWTHEAKQFLTVVPQGYDRRRAKARIEKLARMRRLPAITREFAEENIDEAYTAPAAQSAPVAAAAELNGAGVAEVNGIVRMKPPDVVAPPVVASGTAAGWVVTPGGGDALRWTDEAGARMERVPGGFMRTMARAKVEEFARRIQAEVVTLDVVEGGLVDARDLMGQMIKAYGSGAEADAAAVPGHGAVPPPGAGVSATGSAPAAPPMPPLPGTAPGWTEDGVRRLREVEISTSEKFEPTRARELAQHAAESRAARTSEAINAAFLEKLGMRLGYGHPLSPKTLEHYFTWTPEAEARLANVPEFCRELTRWRVEWTAYKQDLGPVITPDAMDVKFDLWGGVSHEIQADGPQMEWEPEAADRLARVPEFVKGMVVQAVEGSAREMGSEAVTNRVLDDVIQRWIATGDFHEGRFGFRA
jgi:nucleotide-binding universal stress UspA family protein